MKLQVLGCFSIAQRYLHNTSSWLPCDAPTPHGHAHVQPTALYSPNPSAQDVKAGQLQLPQLQLLEAYFAGCSSVQQRIQAVRKGRPHMVVAC